MFSRVARACLVFVVVAFAVVVAIALVVVVFVVVVVVGVVIVSFVLVVANEALPTASHANKCEATLTQPVLPLKGAQGRPQSV